MQNMVKKYIKKGSIIYEYDLSIYREKNMFYDDISSGFQEFKS